MTQQFYPQNQAQPAPRHELTPTAHMLKMHIQNVGKITLPIADLLFLQAEGNYCWLHWKDGQRLLAPRTLKYYEPQLPPEWFVRPHRHCIINLLHIERMEHIHPDKGGLVYLRSGEVLPVSRRRWVAFKRIYQQSLHVHTSAHSSSIG